MRPSRMVTIAFAAILIPPLIMMAYAAYHESATFDESAHIPAGYGYVHELDYRLNPEHPPLVKALSALPLLALNLNFPTHLKAWQEDVNGEWVMGGNFFYESGNDGQMIVRVARIAPILITLLLALFIYLWAKRLMGPVFALLPTFLFAWSPNVIAHGHYVTTDVGAALGITFGTFFFIRLLFDPSRKHLVYAGLAFGLAQLLKFSAVLLIPYFLLLTAAYYSARLLAEWNTTARAWHYLRATLGVFVIGYVLVVYPAYFLFTYRYPPARQARDAEVILTGFRVRWLADATIAASRTRLLQPFAEYSLGVLTTLQRSEGGNANYFFGKVSGTGTPSYFPIVYLLKETLPALLVIAVAAWFGIRRAVRTLWSERAREWIAAIGRSEHSFTVFAMLLFVAIYWAASIRSPLNIGFRHLFPTLPFVYILAALAWRNWIADPKTGAPHDFLALAVMRMRSFAGALVKLSVLAVLMAWLALETLAVAPYFLSYFNELGGGAQNGYRYATDSNYDWGQDLLRLQSFLAAHPEIDKIAVDYFGGGSPKYFLGDREENWWSARGNPADSGIRWFAVSVNQLEGSIQPTKGFYERKPQDEYRWLTSARQSAPGLGSLPEPDFRAGTSIFIYKL